jgi:hypothetical protein
MLTNLHAVSAHEMLIFTMIQERIFVLVVFVMILTVVMVLVLDEVFLQSMPGVELLKKRTSVIERRHERRCGRILTLS